MSSALKVLTVGAAGKFAGLVIPELAQRGATVRGLVRKAEQAEAVKQQGSAEIAVGDLSDRASIEAALKGIDAVFYIAPAFLQDEARVGRYFVEAAQRAGVRRFVFSSVIHPVISTLANHSEKGPVEEAILESGLDYCFLHPTVFFQNFAGSWPQVVESGVLAEPWSAETKFSRVDYRDVAEAAAIALTTDRLLNGTFELCSEGWLDRHEVATLAGEALGRPVRAGAVDPKVATTGAPPALAAGLQKMFAWYDQRGLKGSALTLRAILGREPRSLLAYFQELAKPSGAASSSKGRQ